MLLDILSGFIFIPILGLLITSVLSIAKSNVPRIMLSIFLFLTLVGFWPYIQANELGRTDYLFAVGLILLTVSSLVSVIKNKTYKTATTISIVILVAGYLVSTLL